jgi:hypothetical protein
MDMYTLRNGSSIGRAALLNFAVNEHKVVSAVCLRIANSRRRQLFGTRAFAALVREDVASLVESPFLSNSQQIVPVTDEQADAMQATSVLLGKLVSRLLCLASQNRSRQYREIANMITDMTDAQVRFSATPLFRLCPDSLPSCSTLPTRAMPSAPFMLNAMTITAIIITIMGMVGRAVTITDMATDMDTATGTTTTTSMARAAAMTMTTTTDTNMRTFYQDSQCGVCVW